MEPKKQVALKKKRVKSALKRAEKTTEAEARLEEIRKIRSSIGPVPFKVRDLVKEIRK